MKLSGQISVSELVETYDEIFSHPDFHVDMHAIWDLTALDLKRIPVSDVRQLPNELRKYMDRRGDYKAALVTGRATDFYLLRMYINILKLIGSNIRFRLFRSRDDAYAWISERKVA